MAIRNGTSGNDILFGTSDDDTMFGGNGDDTFMASAGSDLYIGGAGNDTVDYSRISSSASFGSVNFGIQVSLQDGEGREFGAGIGLDHYSSIENVTGSNFLDIIEGDGNANIIRGLDGDDFIEGMGGADVLEGGNGIDTLMYGQSNARVVVDLQNNTASGGHATGDVISGFENIDGSNFNDILSGTNGRNDIYGSDGNDTINARGGNDTIEGGRGNDVMTGGSGSDTFFFNIHQELTGVDHITDFDVTRDSIDIRYQGGHEPTITMTAGNYNLADMSVDLVLHVRDDAGEAGTIVLDHIAIADINDVMGQINFQEVA
jgi:Ca2+-binding RTX toxin-like protein